VDEWVSGGPGVRNGSCVCSLPAAVKIYNKRDVCSGPHTPATAACQGGRWQPTLWISVNFELIPPPSRLHFARVPVLLCSIRPCGVGGWQALLWCRVDAWIFGGPGCGMEVVFVRCRRLLEYIVYDIKL